MSATTPRACACAETRVLSASGPDARAFLHAQLTRHLLNLGTDQAALGAWLDAKGRVLTLLEVVPAAAGWLLLLPADLAESVLERLGRYVLRADVRLALDADVAVHAVVGEATSWLADRGVELAAAPWSLARSDTITWLRVGPELVRALGPAAAVVAALRGLPAAAPGAVDLAEIRLGLPRVDAVTSARYVAQMLNLDRLGALSFDKGCYPGQEIVARTQNLGSVKRRLAHFGSGPGALPPPGAALTDAAGEHAGEVLRAARSADGIELLAVVRSESSELRLASDTSEAPPLERLPAD